MRVRVFEKSDMDDVIALWHECDLVVPWNDPVKDIEAKLKVQPELFFVGEIDGKIVASAMAGYGGHRGVVFYLAVKPEYHREGYGKALMDHIAVELKKLGCPKINIDIRKSNLDVIRFYESLGYKMDDVVVMGKRLDTDG